MAQPIPGKPARLAATSNARASSSRRLGEREVAQRFALDSLAIGEQLGFDEGQADSLKTLAWLRAVAAELDLHDVGRTLLAEREPR